MAVSSVVYSHSFKHLWVDGLADGDRGREGHGCGEVDVAGLFVVVFDRCEDVVAG